MKKLFFTLFAFILSSGLIHSYGQASMIVSPGVDITVGPGVTLDVGGEKLLLEDDYSHSPSLLQYGTVSFSGGGEAMIEQYLQTDRWHMVSSPVQDEVIETYLWHYLAQYHENDDTWTYLNLPLTIPLNVGEGYFAWKYATDPNGSNPPSPDSVVFSGTMNFQDVNLSLGNTVSSANTGWNLIGNPFPIAIEWNGHTDWNLSNVGATMYIYDNAASGNYVNWNYNLGTGTNPNGGYISSTQGFWVRTAVQDGSAASLTIPASQRAHNAATFLKSGNEELQEQLMLKVAGNGHSDKTIIGFYSEATSGFDPEYDGIYYYPIQEVLSMYSVVHGQKYALNELPSINEHPIIAVDFESRLEGEYSLSADWLDRFPEDLPIFLEDKQENVFQDLRLDPVYRFTSNPDDNYKRFNIYFNDRLDQEVEMENILIFSWQQTVIVDVPFEISGNVMIYDISGRLITEEDVHMGRNEIAMERANGNYIVRIIANEGVISNKVYIK
jgi:hypothetical protein